MFGDGQDATSRFLVADEVGLGKTLVARGVIAQVIDHLKGTGDKRVDIVYLASNGSIAAQNVRKLAPRGVSTINRADRLSMLPYLIGDMARQDVNVIALTPGTSVDLGSSGGMFPERAAAFAALGTIWSGQRLRGVGIANIFAGAIKDRDGVTAAQRLRNRAQDFGSLPQQCREIFEAAMRNLSAIRHSDRPQFSAFLPAVGWTSFSEQRSKAICRDVAPDETPLHFATRALQADDASACTKKFSQVQRSRRPQQFRGCPSLPGVCLPGRR